MSQPLHVVEKLEEKKVKEIFVIVAAL